MSVEFSRILKDGGILEITEARKEYYSQNYYLDYLWYRWIIPRYEIWFSNTYRDCRDYFKEFNLDYYDTLDEKEVFIFIKKNGHIN